MRILNCGAVAIFAALSGFVAVADIDRPWMMVNEDADHVFHWNNRRHPGQALTKETIREYVDPFMQPEVTHFLVALCNRNVLYESEVFDTRWKLHEERGCTCPQSRTVETMAATFRGGLDPYRVMIDRAREKGIVPWLSMRMNDLHSISDTEVWKCFGSTLGERHPEYQRNPKAVAKKGTPWTDLALDYAHEEVRERMLRGLAEMLEKYDADGFEFDWLRFEHHLTPGREEELGWCLTDFMRRARAVVDAAAKRRGHPITVAARVTSTPEAAKGLGTDALLWAQEGIIDVIIPCNFLVQTDFRMPLRRWLEEARAKNPKVRVVAGCDQKVTKQYPISWYNLQLMTPEEYYGWFELMLTQGATGFYFFNHFDIPRHRMKFVTTDRLTYERVARARRAYPLSWHETVPNRAMSERWLPATTTERHDLTIPIGRAPQTGKAMVLLGFASEPDASVKASVRLNGVAASEFKPLASQAWLKPLDEPEFDRPEARFTKSSIACAFPVSALKDGDNVITVGGAGVASNVLHACELVIGPGRPQQAEGSTVRAFDRDVYVHNANYDEKKIAPYALEDPLTFLDGRKVATPDDWPARRKEILDLFAKEMLGAEPPAPEAVVTELVDEKVGAVAGFGIRRQYRMWFRKDRSGPCVNWIVWLPRHAKKPVPVISFLNYRGNYEIVPDKDIPLMTAWSRNGEKFGIADHRAGETTRGLFQNPDSDTVVPLGMILARGYALMSACYCEVSPDPDWTEENPLYHQNPFAYTGVFDLWGPRDPARTDNITSLGAWAWALSRGLDLAERIPEIDAKRSVVTGCSRLGKSALIAAARDERFRVCVPNQCGGGGVRLAKRDYGENVSTENRMFTHWYCTAYAKYAKEPWKTLTFDQHLLLACIAPRAVLVQGFDTSKWMEASGEFEACRAAAPVWKFLGKRTMPDVPGYPGNYDESAIGGDLGFVRRSEQHGIAAIDWKWTLDFADGVFGS